MRSALLMSIALGGCSLASAQVEPVSATKQGQLLAAGFSDHMVVQRGKDVKIWGNATKGADVSVEFAGQTLKTSVNEDGKWSVTYPPVETEKATTIYVSSSEGMSQSVSDVLVGDVLYCSGQSNMEYPVSRALNPNRELTKEAVSFSEIRLLTIPQYSSLTPSDGYAEGGKWELASIESVTDFSAICWFTGKQMHVDSGVPIGLVDASWGGTRIEAWLNDAAVRSTGLMDDDLTMKHNYISDSAKAVRQMGADLNKWWTTKFSDKKPLWNDAEAKDWKTAPEAMGDYQSWGVAEISEYTGLIWFQAELDLPADFDGASIPVSVGLTDERDYVWVNGDFVGSAFGWSDHSVYDVPEGVLKPGKNIVTVMVENGWRSGGIVDLSNSGTNWNDSQFDLKNWKWTYFADGPKGALRAAWEPVNGIGSLYNGMVAPLAGMKFAAALWYQGESNTGEPVGYDTKLKALIQSWRTEFNADLPAVIVQLANYGELTYTPVNSGWAGVREAERRVAVEDDLTGVVVTADIGDRYDIHPPNKQAVSKRILHSLAAMKSGDASAADGVQPVSAMRTDNGIEVIFNVDAESLHVTGGPFLSGVELCFDAVTCEFAAAKLDGNKLMIAADQSSDVKTVRYAWSDAPVVTLFDSNADPVTPFEIAVE